MIVNLRHHALDKIIACGYPNKMNYRNLLSVFHAENKNTSLFSQTITLGLGLTTKKTIGEGLDHRL